MDGGYVCSGSHNDFESEMKPLSLIKRLRREFRSFKEALREDKNTTMREAAWEIKKLRREIKRLRARVRTT